LPDRPVGSGVRGAEMALGLAHGDRWANAWSTRATAFSARRPALRALDLRSACTASRSVSDCSGRDHAA
jgi:hypothetical protein